MKDWVGLLTAVIQLVTAVILYRLAVREKNKKGTKKRSPRGKRK
ncbi:hypothetical protein [Paenibacillus contaminans]|nr:hypothetical protein [Paenibacillus contaminans]